MLLYLASGQEVYAFHSAFGREANYIRLGVRTDSLCSFFWPPGRKFMLLILRPDQKLIIQDHLSGRIVYDPFFGLRAVSLCFLFYVWA